MKSNRSRKTHLSRYRPQDLTRTRLENEAWLGTPTDYRSTIDHVRHVMFDNGLVPVSSLPEEELLARYFRQARKILQHNARARDLDLYELNPDDPESSILFADTEILAKMGGRWTLMYVQSANFDEHELLRARMYAQVVAHLYPTESSQSLLKTIGQPSSYDDWEKLERTGRVHRDLEGNLTIAGVGEISHDTARQPGDTRERRATDYACLSTAENDFLQHTNRWGSDGYPIRKMKGGRWIWESSHGIKGSPTVYRTLRDGHLAIENYISSLMARISESATS